jgi:hypothetical protein
VNDASVRQIDPATSPVIFSGVELARLSMYRAAVRAGFYSETLARPAALLRADGQRLLAPPDSGSVARPL